MSLLRDRRAWPAAAATAVCMIVPGLTALPAQASPPCTNTVPSLDQQVSCTNTGATAVDITIPAGALSVEVVVKGAGGGAGGADAAYVGGNGGNGARVTASLDVSDVSVLSLVTGAGGANGVGGGSASPGVGGGYSAIWAGPRSAQIEPMVIAGGGGGGGTSQTVNAGAGGAGAANATGAGGNGSGLHAGNGADGTGSGGIGRCGSIGDSWAAGGAGTGSYSVGGSGFGGGGGGDAVGPAGAGGSVAASGRLGTVTYSPDGGDGGVGSVGAAGSPGADGSLTLVFRSTRVRALATGPTFRLSWSGTGTGDSSRTASTGTWVATPTAAEWTRAGFTLLGWATDSSFPVELARQATSAFDGPINGTRIVYIPAGKSTFVTGDNTLHAIWGSATPAAARIC